MLKPLITIEDWSGGMTFNASYGRKNQFFTSNGIDFERRKGYITQAPIRENVTLSGGNIGVDIFAGVYSTNTYKYYGSSLGRIYKDASAATVTLDHTSSNATSNIISFKEYKGVMYYAQDVAGKVGSLIGSSTYDDNELSLSTASSMPMIVAPDPEGEKLYIGYNNHIARWNETTLNATALDLPARYQIVTLETFGWQYIIAGANNIAEGGSKLFLWDKVATTWNNEVPLPEQYIYATLEVKGNLWILAGSKNLSIYVMPIGSLTPIKVHQFYQDDLSQAARSFANALTYRDGRVYFGISDSDYKSQKSETLVNGVYSISTDLNNINICCHYKIPTFTTGNTTQRIYFVATIFDTIFHSQTSLTTAPGTYTKLLYKETFSTPDDANAIKSYWYQAPAGTTFNFDGFGLDFTPLENGQSVTLQCYLDFDLTTPITLINGFSTLGKINTYLTKQLPCRAIMFKLMLSEGVPNKLYLKRLYATGKAIADTQ